ncbi:glutathione S-transferase [Haemophilus paracuniculus]|uniref:glutathione transferase n=1 Tax=Haemophilus paracuniculus TaxID=734 RepID=A0A1T0AST3_9PAST|nr:glutathione S-transferase [Haemophilus paracuniculus]OOR99435.1 glutathione S-transferase [Haemophilus paracuniculus]
MITLYVLLQSRANRIAWLLEELNLAYQVEIFERDQHTKLAPATLKKIHPLGKSPILKDGNLVLAESGAIVEYLIERYGQGKLKPQAESADYPHYLHWLHYAEGSLMFPLLLSLVFRKIDHTKMPFFVKPIANKISDKVKQGFIEPQLKLHFDYVEQALAGKKWLVNDRLSGADIMMSFPLQAVLLRSDLDYPNIRAYVARIEALESWQRAEQKVGILELNKL